MAEASIKSGVQQFVIDLGRAAGGALLFAFPLLMTMEMWEFGFAMDRFRLALFILLSLPVLFGLSYYSGFERTQSRWEDLEAVFIAYGIAFFISAIVLFLFGLINWDMSLDEVLGKIGLQTVPASIGAMLARRQLSGGGDNEEEDEGNEEHGKRASYAGELFLMMAGAVFVAFNVAPTEEMVLIAYTMTPWHAAALAVASIAVLHAFVYTVGFGGQEERPEGKGFLATFLHFTMAGYGIALLISLYVLWTFGRTYDVSIFEISMMVVVLAFPSALGAATARLIV